MSGTRTILHVDMDAFFVSVELLTRPELVGRPVVVGGSGQRGVVAAASYEARAFGIHSATPSVRARKLCPGAVFLQGNYSAYAAVSARIMELLRDVTPLVEPLSLDEAFCDVTGALSGQRTGVELASQVRHRIRRTEGLECAVGVASTKFVAKIASKHAKPAIPRPGQRPIPGSGVVEVADGDTVAFLSRLSVTELWGVGPVTGELLAEIGVQTIGDLAGVPTATLTSRLGRAAGVRLHELARGVDPRPVIPDQAPKSISQEETFVSDHTSIESLHPELLRLADATAARLLDKDLVGRTISIKVRYADFRTVTRSVTLDEPTDQPRQIARAARELLQRLDLNEGVRLLGISVMALGVDTGTRQLTFDMFGDAVDSWTDAERAVGEIRSRFGDGAIASAALVDAAGLRVHRRGDQQWGPNAQDGNDSVTKWR